MVDNYKLACECVKNGEVQILLNALINMQPGSKAKCKKEILRAISECNCLESFERKQFINIISEMAHNKKEPINVRDAALHCLEALETTSSKVSISVNS